MKFNSFFFASLSIALLFLFSFCELGFCREDSIIRMKILGGLRDLSGNVQNSAEIESLGRFAVQEHNKKENALLEFARVIKAKEQVVAGKLYHLTLEVSDAGKRKVYEAKVWVKPWMNFKQLQEFQHARDAPPYNQGDHELGWKSLSTNDPVVQDAAQHAVTTIQLRSNSLFPYELLEILLAKAESLEKYVKFNLLLKVRRGIKEEKFEVVMKKIHGGKFLLESYG